LQFEITNIKGVIPSLHSNRHVSSCNKPSSIAFIFIRSLMYCPSLKSVLSRAVIIDCGNPFKAHSTNKLIFSLSVSSKIESSKGPNFNERSSS